MNKTLRLRSELPDYLRDAEETVRAFYPYVVIADDAEEEIFLSALLTDSGDFLYGIRSPFGVFEGTKRFEGNFLERKKYSKRFFKNLLYDMLATASGVTLPYGALTGVRPTKLFYELSEEFGESAFSELQTEFRVSEEKAALVRDTVSEQKEVYDYKNDAIDLFINIPFCPTRCAYCSFLSAEYPKIKKLIPSYLEAVCRELDGFKNYLEQTGRPLRAVYVGGGTPTSLDVTELSEILRVTPVPEKEFTVEAGRPDTLTEEHLKLLKEVGVTRVSVNPQTLSDEVLQNIGRKHTAEDFYRAFQLVSQYGFSVNTDFIAGLQGETKESFRNGIETVAALAPDNITVHTLSLKRGSTLSESGVKKGEFGAASEMVNAAREILTANGYRPYYLYRQKNTADNLENVGYAKAGKASFYNVDIMEETTDIYAVGAGAMSKRIEKERKLVTRLANPKGLHDYLSRVDEILLKKSKFFG